MNLYRYWTTETDLIAIDGEERLFKAYGRSNVSREDATRDAKERLQKVRLKLAGEWVGTKQDYSADLREEIVIEKDSRNLVSRNRYGALVWNTTEFSILDIDSYKPGFWERWGILKPKDPKKIMRERLEKMADKPAYVGLGLRIYETVQGYRVILLGKYVEPESPGFWELMDDSYTDPLYAYLCRKQNCYRARLTPKPYRMAFKGIRYKWPVDAAAYAEAQEWVKNYEVVSAGYASCRYVNTLGTYVGTPEAVALHDRYTGAETGRPLA